MKYQILLSRKNIISLSSAEFTHRMVSAYTIEEQLDRKYSFFKLTTLWKIQQTTNWSYFYCFSLKIGPDTPCKLSPKETICMKYQILFSRNNNIFQNVNWVHKKCSGLKCFTKDPDCRCTRCQGTVCPLDGRPQREVQIESDKLEVVASFCYIADMLSAAGGCELSTTTRVKTAWKKFKELLPVLSSPALSFKTCGGVYSSCVRSAMLHASETFFFIFFFFIFFFFLFRLNMCLNVINTYILTNIYSTQLF